MSISKKTSFRKSVGRGCGVTMQLNENVIAIQHMNKVILVNKFTGLWLRITKEIYEYFISAIKMGYSKEKFIQAFSNPEDQDYILQLILKMDEIGIIGEHTITFSKAIAFEITNRCNLSCTHCCFSANEQKKDLSTEKVLDILTKIIQWEPQRITITGGEPLIRNDIFKLLKFLRLNYKGTIILATNALLLNEKNIDFILRYIDVIDISIDGVDEESCKKIRGKGVFEKVVSNIRLLKEKGFPKISLSMVLTEGNEKLINDFFELNKKLGTIPVIRRLAWVGRALENKKVFTDKDLLYEKSGKIENDEKYMCTYSNCQQLKSKYHIRFDGYVYACQTIYDRKYAIGHIDEIASFDKIKDNHLQWLIDDLLKVNEDCRECSVMPLLEMSG